LPFLPIVVHYYFINCRTNIKSLIAYQSLISITMSKKVIRTTEQTSKYKHLEQMSTAKLLNSINKEDEMVPKAIKKAMPQIKKMVDAAYKQMALGGRLFYIGAGTSGRLGIVDASECPPTFGVPQGLVVGLIAGGDAAIRKAVEFAEDDVKQGWIDLKKQKISPQDFVVGIAASGSTPYVIGALQEANKNGNKTACIVCNNNSSIAAEAQFPIEVIVGPEFVTGSTRMKAGTAQKLTLNMISTSLMIKLGRVKGNKMVDMQLSNHKLIERGTKMIIEELSINEQKAAALLKKHGSVRKAVEAQNIKAK
jgi:N-acetylmuramic acid 6-phosphate etherase